MRREHHRLDETRTHGVRRTKWGEDDDLACILTITNCFASRFREHTTLTIQLLQKSGQAGNASPDASVR